MEGNTNSSISQHRRWCFTLNNPSVDTDDTLDTLLRSECRRFVFALEVGESGTPHYQGYMEFKNARTFNGVKALIPGAHIEVAKGNAQKNYTYCTKSVVRGPWKFGYKAGPKDPIETPRPFQQKIIRLYNEEPDNRTIHWYWDAAGGTGKTALAKHLCLKGDTLYVSGKAADVKSGVTDWIVKKGTPLRCVIFGIPRDAEGFISYGALEAVKDGIFFNTKYESQMVLYEPPHVFVFANFPPDTSKLSMDRWKIEDIGVQQPFHAVSVPLDAPAAAGAGGISAQDIGVLELPDQPGGYEFERMTYEEYLATL